ncbi:MAG: hypothetical protein H7X77_01435 [Anaerolineae bacterium]|nr:hypothetical protein [Anaerolineae bacterium]
MTPVSNENLVRLNTALYSRFMKYNITLQVINSAVSITGERRNAESVISYMRMINEAQTVEAMMGRDLPIRRLDMRCHPVIELRLNEAGLALELIVAPDAWCDQQNLNGKLSIERHRQTFRQMIARLDDNYRLGFGQDMSLDAMHLKPFQAAHPAVFEKWITTFGDGQDWFRIGVWYDTLPENLLDMKDELFRQAQVLYDFYTFIAWTGNNNFRAFQQRQLAYA